MRQYHLYGWTSHVALFALNISVISQPHPLAIKSHPKRDNKIYKPASTIDPDNGAERLASWYIHIFQRKVQYIMTDSHAGVKWRKYIDTMTGCTAKWPSWNRRNSGAKVIESATSSQWHNIMTSGSSCSKQLITLKFSCLKSPEFNLAKVMFHCLFLTRKIMRNFTFPNSYYWGIKSLGSSRYLFTSRHGATWNRTWILKDRKLILTLSLHSF